MERRGLVRRHHSLLKHISMMSFLKRRGSLKLANPTSTFKVQYLGNVSTNIAKGDKCVDKPITILWNNFMKTMGKQTVNMKVSVDNNGLKVFTQTQGLTHYWCHRISHFRVPKNHPKIVVWIYRHVGKKLKVELRCHAIMMESEKKANALVEILSDKVTASLLEYRREKARRHRRQLVHEKAAAHMNSQLHSGGRTKLLSTSKNYKPPPEYSLTLQPGLSAISEETADSSSDESSICESPYSTIGRWRLSQCNKNHDNRQPYIRPSERLKIDSEADINMNQLPDTATTQSKYENTVIDFSLCTDDDLDIKDPDYSSESLNSDELSEESADWHAQTNETILLHANQEEAWTVDSATIAQQTNNIDESLRSTNQREPQPDQVNHTEINGELIYKCSTSNTHNLSSKVDEDFARQDYRSRGCSHLCTYENGCEESELRQSTLDNLQSSEHSIYSGILSDLQSDKLLDLNYVIPGNSRPERRHDQSDNQNSDRPTDSENLLFGRQSDPESENSSDSCSDCVNLMTKL